MIRKLSIDGFKSLAKVELELGRVNVLIGENGAGKSNLLEALAFGAAASTRQLSHEFLASRGVRSVAPELMHSALPGAAEAIRIKVAGDDGLDLPGLHLEWTGIEWFGQALSNAMLQEFAAFLADTDQPASKEALAGALRHARTRNPTEGDLRPTGLPTFLAYSPEYSALRTFQDETQILPLGVRGEGLFSHLKDLANQPDPAVFREIADQMDLLDWFAGFDLPGDLAPGERRLRIRDRYLTEQRVFDQRSANEGFLFLLFYFTLFISPATPSVYGIDNIDTSLNPKLCIALMQRLAALAKRHGKQVLLTTHNPSVLDGLDLSDPEQKLFVVSRDSKGQTRVKPVSAPVPLAGDAPMRLSEAFLQGYLGGLPQNF
jgi:predicted ATPase